MDLNPKLAACIAFQLRQLKILSQELYKKECLKLILAIAQRHFSA